MVRACGQRQSCRSFRRVAVVSITPHVLGLCLLLATLAALAWPMYSNLPARHASAVRLRRKGSRRLEGDCMSKRKRGADKASARVPRTDVVDRVEEQAAALDIRRKQRIATVEALRGDRRTPLRVIEVAAQSAAVADEAFNQAVDRHSLKDRIACREGCAWCCYSQVRASVPEVLRIAEYLRTALSQDDLAATCQRLAALDEKTRGMSNLQRAEAALPCALLVNDRCSVYSVRPIACRKYHSADASVCERSFKETTNSLSIPMFYSVFERVTHVQDGLLAGLSEAGLKADLHELTTALRIALETPDAPERWLRGEKVFPTCLARGFSDAR